MDRMPNSKVNLDRAISRYTNRDTLKATELGVAMANAIVAQLIGDGVVKGGTSLKFRYGDASTRYTTDLDTAWKESLDSFIAGIKARLAAGWNGFTGEVLILKPANPKKVPFDYVMQPCSVKLSYLGTPWRTVDLEIGHNEIGDADEFDEIPVPDELAKLMAFLAFPPLGNIKAMKLEYQIAQKLHGASENNSKRAHELIELQLIFAKNKPDLELTGAICRKLFKYRRKQPWPSLIEKGEHWDDVYDRQKRDLPVLPTVDEAIKWTNALIARLSSLGTASIED